MEGTKHFIVFTIVWIGLLVWRLILHDVNWSILKCLWFGFLVTNPDWDIIFGKMCRRLLHRWFFTHSVLFPLFLYWLSKDYIIMEDLTTKEYGLCLFIPMIVHLLADFGIHKLLDDDKKDTAGSWQISMYPVKNPFAKRKGSYRLGAWGSVLYMVFNIGVVGSYIIWTYDLLSWF